LANRLETLSKKGLLKYTKLPNDQKTKIYYLTDKGIDMYPIIYEMINWSSRNINMEFGHTGKVLINHFENTQQEIVIADAQSAYRSERHDILAHSS
jgi:DNA-binding HxlR family transcriptional regulator